MYRGFGVLCMCHFLHAHVHIHWRYKDELQVYLHSYLTGEDVKNGSECWRGRERKATDTNTIHQYSSPVLRAHNTTHIPLTESGERSACTTGVSGTIGIGLGLEGNRTTTGRDNPLEFIRREVIQMCI